MSKRPKIEDRAAMFDVLKGNDDQQKKDSIDFVAKNPEVRNSGIMNNAESSKKQLTKDDYSESEIAVSRTSLKYRNRFFKGTFFLTAEEMDILEKEKARRRREKLHDKSISCDFSSIIGDAIKKTFT